LFLLPLLLQLQFLHHFHGLLHSIQFLYPPALAEFMRCEGCDSECADGPVTCGPY
jgi:hypothetical protein